MVLDSYLGGLMKNNQLVEMFLEQRRSRSGKIQRPNEVLLDHIISQHIKNEGSKKDILFVPVTINYDRVIEGELFPHDLLGEAPEKESLTKIFKHFSNVK